MTSTLHELRALHSAATKLANATKQLTLREIRDHHPTDNQLKNLDHITAQIDRHLVNLRHTLRQQSRSRLDTEPEQLFPLHPTAPWKTLDERLQ